MRAPRALAWLVVQLAPLVLLCRIAVADPPPDGPHRDATVVAIPDARQAIERLRPEGPPPGCTCNLAGAASPAGPLALLAASASVVIVMRARRPWTRGR